MSRRSALRRLLSAACVLLASGTLGCWEQWSDTWWPQMKRQKAIQAFEEVGYRDQVAAFMPPEGTLPVSAPPPLVAGDDAAADALANPRPMSLDSLENGRAQYERYCAVCHGATGMGDGPVSMTGDIQGPLGGVLPLIVATARSDGHVYATIQHGRRRMPSYQRILSDDRWDIVNYIRYLTGAKGVAR